MKRHFGKKATKRIYAAMPWIGGGLALAVGAVLKKRRVPQAIQERAERAREIDRDLVSIP